MKNIVIFASGNGTNAENIIRYFKEKNTATISNIITNNPKAGVINRAENLDVPVTVLDKEALQNPEKLLTKLKDLNTDLIVLAGFLKKIPDEIVAAYPNRIINIHPALLPSFKGLHAQKQAIEAGVKFSGATVHFVTKDLDSGPIIAQSVVPVFDGDDEDTLSDRILKTEHKIYPLAIKLLCDNRLELENNRVKIKDYETMDENFYIINPKEDFKED